METITLDSNVLISGLLRAGGPPGTILDWLRNGDIQLALDDRIIAKYEDVLLPPKFRLPKREVSVLLDGIISGAVWPDIGPAHRMSLPGPDDEPFAECAFASQSPLVTGNVKHYPKPAMHGVLVFSPSLFVLNKASQ